MLYVKKELQPLAEFNEHMSVCRGTHIGLCRSDSTCVVLIHSHFKS